MNAESGFFTLGVPPDAYCLPHEKLELPFILLIRRVLCRAFDQLREEQFNLVDAQEDHVTAALLAVMETNPRQSGAVHRTEMSPELSENSHWILASLDLVKVFQPSSGKLPT
ncbi:MAG: hypothetical protein R3C05_13325 [Pirellulaceae bacterium]